MTDFEGSNSMQSGNDGQMPGQGYASTSGGSQQSPSSSRADSDYVSRFYEERNQAAASQSQQSYGAQNQFGANASNGGASQQPQGYQAGQGYTQPAGYQQNSYGQAPQHPLASAQGPSAAASPLKAGKSGGSFWKSFIGAAIATILILGIYTGVQGATNTNNSNSGSSPSIVLGNTESRSIDAEDTDPTLAEAVADKALPSVACIYAYVDASSYYRSYGFGLDFGSNGDSQEYVQSSLGSGVVLSEDGYIITNYHVIEGADYLQVNIAGTDYAATVVGTDESSDIAVIKAEDASGLTPAEIGDSDNLRVGEWVMSIGSPFGLEQSVATGVVSATSRSQVYDSSESDAYGYEQGSGTTTIYPNMIQTDAAINPGNSGGALVDAEGRLIGINTLITSYSGNYSGVGFAIPINYAINLANQIISGETPTHARLGVTMVTVNSSNAQRYRLAVSSGAYVSSIYPGSGAEAAGLAEGDIITAINGKAISSVSDVMLAVREHNPGDTLTVTFNRNGTSMEVEVTLTSDSDEPTSPSSY